MLCIKSFSCIFLVTLYIFFTSILTCIWYYYIIIYFFNYKELISHLNCTMCGRWAHSTCEVGNTEVSQNHFTIEETEAQKGTEKCQFIIYLTPLCIRSVTI